VRKDRSPAEIWMTKVHQLKSRINYDGQLSLDGYKTTAVNETLPYSFYRNKMIFTERKHASIKNK
jgi:hypothetical protein